MKRASSTGGDDAGFVGGFEGLVFGLLLFVVGTLLVADAWAVVDTKLAADAAARQAVRSYVEAPAAGMAGPDARQAALASLEGYGRSPGRAQVALVSGGFARCDRVTIEVRYPSPVLTLPWIGKVGDGIPVTARSSELVDPFRTGLPGTSSSA